MAIKRRTHLAQYIISTRERRGWDRADLSRASGVPVTTIKNIEDNPKDVKPKEETLRKLADALGETASERVSIYRILRMIAHYDDPPHLEKDDLDEKVLNILKARPAWAGIRERLLRVPDDKIDWVVEMISLQFSLLNDTTVS